jgi:anti-anti-sigma factor
LKGRLTIDSSPDLRDRLRALLFGGSLQKLSIDLEGVPYIDSAGLATLLETLKLARACHTVLQLTGLHDRPLYLLQFTGLLPLFESSADLTPASVSERL